MKTNYSIAGACLWVLAAAFWPALLTGCGGDAADAPGAEPAEVRRIPVVMTQAASRTFEDRLKVQGNLEAKHFAMVPALVPGTITGLFVDEGDWVKAGETKLFQIDDVKLRRAHEIAQQDVAIARLALQEKAANLERVEADFAKAELDYERFRRLRARDAATQDALEQQESRFKQTRAMLKHARTLVALGHEQVRQAEAALAIAKKNLDDSLVHAPFTGVVSMKFFELSEMADTGKPVFRIEDPALLEASALLPAQYYARIRVGETRVRITAHGVEVGEFPVSYRSPTIHPKLRTFEVKCLVPDPPEGVTPGAMADCFVLFEKREGIGVPTASVLRRDGKAVVFTVADEQAKLVEITPGLENDGWTELRGGALEAGAEVVAQGQFLLDDGTPVTVKAADAAGSGEAG